MFDIVSFADSKYISYQNYFDLIGIIKAEFQINKWKIF